MSCSNSHARAKAQSRWAVRRFFGSSAAAIARAKDLYARARPPYERVEPVAEAFGAAGYAVRTPEALEVTLTKALADGRPAVIEVKTTIGDAAATPWKYLMPGWTSTP